MMSFDEFRYTFCEKGTTKWEQEMLYRIYLIGYNQGKEEEK